MAGQAVIIDDTAIRLNGIQALNKALGHSGALRFIAMIHREPTDYVEISRRLYEGLTVDGIFARAKKNWKQTRR
jgi:hypothetical protein